MSKADGRPAYSEHGLENRPLFFAGCNNVNIYVEDTALCLNGYYILS